MSNAETVESYLHRSDLPYEQLDPETWVILLPNQRRSRLALRIDDPIVLFSTPVLNISADTMDRERLFQTLLELNNDLLHGAYALQNDRIVLSGAQLLANFNLAEFQIVVDDMALAMDTHHARLADWHVTTPKAAEAAQKGDA